ncbi:60S ribosomal protein L19-2, putative, partial [Entamoeba invadens IP1]
KVDQGQTCIRKPHIIHSRSRVVDRLHAKRLGRHSGHGKRKGTKNARTPQKSLWVFRMRVLRRLLAKYRAMGKIDKHVYHDFYMMVKGNQFKNKKALAEAIFKTLEEKKLAAKNAEKVIKTTTFITERKDLKAEAKPVLAETKAEKRAEKKNEKKADKKVEKKVEKKTEKKVEKKTEKKAEKKVEKKQTKKN